MEKSDFKNIAVTSALITHHLFDNIYESVKGRGGVMMVLDIIGEQTLKFIEDHQEVEKSGNWDDFTADKGYSDWEEYLIATIEGRLEL